MKRTLAFAVFLTLAIELSGQAMEWPGFFCNDFAKYKIESTLLSINHDFGFGLKALATDQISISRRLSLFSVANISIMNRGDQYLSSNTFSSSWIHKKDFALISLGAQVTVNNIREAQSSRFKIGVAGDFELFPNVYVVLELSVSSHPAVLLVGTAIRYQVLDRLVGVLSFANDEWVKKVQVDLEFELIKGCYLSASQELISQSWTIGFLMPFRSNLQMILQYAGVTQLGAKQRIGLNFSL